MKQRKTRTNKRKNNLLSVWKTHGSAFFTAIVSVVLISGLSWGAFRWADYRNLLTVDEIIITGDEIVPEFDYRRFFISALGQSMEEVRLDSLQQGLENHPFVKAARVSKDYPHWIRVEVAERQPLATVNTDPMIMIDEEGFVLPDMENDIKYKIPLLSNFNPRLELYPVGEPALSTKIQEARTLLADIRRTYPALYRNLSEIRLTIQDDYELILMEKPTRVVLGQSALWPKIIRLNAFARTLAGTRLLTDYRTLDLRHANQIIVREWRR